MPSWSLFVYYYYYYLIKISILNFVLVRKEKEEGRRVSHRIFPWQIGDSPRASYPARWHTVPAAEPSVGQALGLRSVSVQTPRAPRRAGKAERRLLPRLSPGLCFPTPAGVGPRSDGADYRAAPSGSRRAAPSLARNRPLPPACNQPCPPPS